MTDRSGASVATWLNAAGLRPTRQRRTLATLLQKGGDRHVTAELLHEEARESGEDVSLATVYNALRQFTAAGLLREIHIDASRTYFDTRLDDHAHFYWEDSGHLEDAPAVTVALDDLPAPPAGAEISSVDVVMRLRRPSR